MKHDLENSNVYTEHQTVEISDLPLTAAANKLTNFTITKEEDMTLSKNKIKYLKEEAGYSDERIQNLQASLDVNKNIADEVGLARKSAGDEAETPVEESPAPETTEVPVEKPAESAPEVVPVEVVPASEPEGQPASESEPVAEPVAETEGFTETQVKGLTEILETVVEGIFTKVQTQIDDAIQPLQQSLENREDLVSKAIEQTPAISLTELVLSNNKVLKDLSVSQSNDAVIKGSTKLAKDGPAEPNDEFVRVSPTAPFSIQAILNDDVLMENNQEPA